MYPAQDRAKEDATAQQEENSRKLEPPGQLLAGRTNDDQAGKDDEGIQGKLGFFDDFDDHQKDYGTY